jgi:hypothetical protein
MKDILISIAAIDASNAAQTLRFSVGNYIDETPNEYPARISKPALLSVSPNDGGLFSFFSAASIGDIELNNLDGALDYLADYAVDGRDVVISAVADDGTVTERFSGTVGRMSENSGQLVLSLKALQETLSNPHPLAIYAGDNALPAGLEGTADTIKGNTKPRVYGDVRNITAVSVNQSLLIYQVSSRADCRVIAVYDSGIRLANFRANGAHSLGAVSIAVNTGIGTIAAGAKVVFANHQTIYTVDVELSAGVIVLTSGLTLAVPTRTVVEIVEFYADTTALQYTDYFVDGEHTASNKSIAITGGVGAINAGDVVFFDSHVAFYTVDVGLTAGVIVLDDGLEQDIDAGELVHVLGAESPAFWGGYQGYFRLTGKPFGAVTCDAVSIDGGGAVHKAGDVFALVAAEVGYSVDSASVAEFNSAGVLGLYVGSSMSTLEIFNKIAASVAGYYHFIGSTIYLNLLQAPAVSEDWTLEDWQIVSRPTRSATGLGGNGIPVYSVKCQYDRIETVQDSIDGNVSSSWRQRLKTQYRERESKDAAVLTRHKLSEPLKVESLLRYVGDVSTMQSRLLPIVKVRRDVINVVVNSDNCPTLVVGSTGKIITPRLGGYATGRKMVLVGWQLDDAAAQVTLTLYG